MRRAFTLIELLVTIGIILILAALAFAVVRWGRTEARIARTRSTITKLDQALRDQMMMYDTRRLPIDIKTFRQQIQATMPGQNPSIACRRFYANARRDLLRIELPDRWTDVENGPLVLRDAITGEPIPLVRVQVLRYLRNEALGRTDEATVEKWASAELLYEWVHGSRTSRIRFHDYESGDIDGDGLREFHDAWGRPISFIRWPAGFRKDRGVGDTMVNADLPDRFERTETLTDNYFTWPLIVSAGPDGEYGLHFGSEGFEYTLDADHNLDSCQQDASRLIGEPTGGGGHLDNIHNHNLYNKL